SCLVFPCPSHEGRFSDFKINYFESIAGSTNFNIRDQMRLAGEEIGLVEDDGPTDAGEFHE
ncbi:hypothetical protein, partial [Burkholderia ubonensis]|uniref:hypothetical protein n=1 Tax=Burkholderia ubonensis TaxID=101571 RepID=UPI001E4F7881